MTSLAVWVLALAAGTAGVSYGATLGQGAHMALAALICAGFVLLALADRSRRVARGDGAPALAGATAASMALVWLWAGLAMLFTYQLVLSWHEWWQYVLAGVGVGGLCLVFTWMMDKDAATGRQDDALLRIARYLTIGQLAGMIIAMIGMIIDGKMPRDPSEPDWAANAIFFFGAAALAVISANALRNATAKSA